MKANFKKYRIAAFALLIVLGINVVVPAVVLAAGFYCSVESGLSEDAVMPAAVCCAAFETNAESGLFGDQDKVEYCTFERVCTQSIADPLTELQSILLAEKDAKTVLPASAFFDTSRDYGIFSHITQDASLSYPTPPIFLVNSTFLN